jgi:hypothetical protein
VNFKRTIKKVTIGIVVLLTIQMITYLLFAHRQLEDKLMSDWFGTLTHSSDSVFVRDFYVTDCNVGDPWTYYSHNLDDEVDEVKKRLRVKYVKFQDKKDHRWDNPEEDEYRLIYHTWTRYIEPWTLTGIFHGPFTTTQIEELRINKTDYYEREVQYHWTLFFWTKSFERIRTP